MSFTVPNQGVIDVWVFYRHQIVSTEPNNMYNVVPKHISLPSSLYTHSLLYMMPPPPPNQYAWAVGSNGCGRVRFFYKIPSIICDNFTTHIPPFLFPFIGWIVRCGHRLIPRPPPMITSDAYNLKTRRKSKNEDHTARKHPTWRRWSYACGTWASILPSNTITGSQLEDQIAGK